MKKALVLSLAAVLGLGFASFAQTLNGSWDTSIIIDPSPVSITIESTLSVTYTVSGWSFTSITAVDGLGWQSQDFEVVGSLGAFSIGSTLSFDPFPVPMFTEWEVVGGLSLAGVTFEGTFTLTPGITKLVLDASGSAGAVDVGVLLTLGGVDCSFDFSNVVITVDFPFCCAEVSSEIKFNCLTGFEYVEFTVADIVVPGISWVTLEAVLTFTVDEKDLDINTNFDFGLSGCFEIYLSQPGELFGDVTVNGIGLECEIGGVSFYGLSYWVEDANKPAILGPYWEMYQISTTDDGCCGPFNFEISIFFDEASLQLFEVAEIDASFDIQISTQFTFGMSIEYLTLGGFSSWSLDFLVEW